MIEAVQGIRAQRLSEYEDLLPRKRTPRWRRFLTNLFVQVPNRRQW